MGDILFSFKGRLKRLGYYFSLACFALAIFGVVNLQRYLGEWKFASIIVMTLAIVPAIIYFAGTSKRFQDRGRHPLIGFILYFCLPALILFGIQKYLQDAFTPYDVLQFKLEGVSKIDEIDDNLLQQLSAMGAAAFFFIIGQISLLLMPGTKGANIFDLNVTDDKVSL